MQICAHCGAKNIDGLPACWRCRQPLGTVAGETPVDRPSLAYGRARGIRPSVGIAMIAIMAAGIGAWWFLRPPEAVELPPTLAGEPAILVEESREQERLVGDRLDISSGYAFYGPSAGSMRYALAVFRDLHGPYTPTFLLNDYQRYIQTRVPFVASEQVLERRADGVLYTCHRVPEPEGMLGQAGLGDPFLWCSWRVEEDELGILIDVSSQSVQRTFELTRRARSAVV